LDLSELQVFLMVAREGSFSRAAERLYRTQPAISLGIRKLEDSLGQPLFVRGSRPVRLTDAGVLLKEYAERLLNLRDEVKKDSPNLKGLNAASYRSASMKARSMRCFRRWQNFERRIPACKSVCTACFRETFRTKC
jgi:DNA-binding transcriptional LysR family regulator